MSERKDLIDGRPFHVYESEEFGPVTVVAERTTWGWEFDIGWMPPIGPEGSITWSTVVELT